MRPVPLANPPNPWASTSVDYLGEPPPQAMHIFEDHSRSILAKNDSPDLGFTWSVNPYRGCLHACAYCMSGDTPILMGDGSTRPIADLRVGNEVYGTVRRGSYRRYARTTVRAHWAVTKPAFRVTLEDGTSLITSADHRFLSRRGWKYVTGAEQGRNRRAHLTLSDKLMGTGKFASTPAESSDYRRGYLCGMIRGDGTLRSYSYDGRRRASDRQHHFRLALIDLPAIQRTQRFLQELELATQGFVFQEARAGYARMHAIRTHAGHQVERIRDLIEWPIQGTAEWTRGFLAGIFDAEGSYSRGILRISNTDARIIENIKEGLRRFDFECVVEQRTDERSRALCDVRLRGGLREHLRFFHTVDNAIVRKRNIEGRAIKSPARLRVMSVESTGLSVPLFDMTTGTGDFIADGVVSHNCYARPTHEYLSFGSGTDFDRKIVVKPKAPELLREAFEKRSWAGDLIMFSGNTDCYQPLEASYRLTRACLEVCAEYQNPVHIITKAPLIERDIDLLTALNAYSSVGVSISIPFWNVEHARAIEPYVATPQRRMKTVKRLHDAGIRVSVNVAPVIPGLSDEDIGAILEAARDAGACSAAMIVLRLPGSVKQVFEERLRAAMPLRAERVLARTREVRSGKLNDPRFGTRQTGEGVYADSIAQLFERTARRLGLATGCSSGAGAAGTFRRPHRGGQLDLFSRR